MIKYIKSVLWRVAKRLSSIQDARCLKVNATFRPARGIITTILHAFVFSPAQVEGSISAPVNIKGEFYVLMTVHLGIFLVNNQPDAQFFFLTCLFQFSTCCEQPCAHHQESQLYQYIWYMSLCIGDRLVCRLGWRPSNPPYLTVIYTE